MNGHTLHTNATALATHNADIIKWYNKGAVICQHCNGSGIELSSYCQLSKGI